MKSNFNYNVCNSYYYNLIENWKICRDLITADIDDDGNPSVDGKMEKPVKFK